MLYYSFRFITFIVFINFLESKNDILSSKFKNINIKLEKNKTFDLFIKELSSEENIFFYSAVTGHFKILNDLINFFIKNGKFILHFNKEKKNTFQIIGDHIQASYQDLFINSNKIDAYVDLENHKNIDIIFENNYKLTYKNFQFGSYNRLYYRNYTLIGNNLWGNNFNLDLSLSIEKLEANVHEQKGLLCNIRIKNPSLNLILCIDKIILDKQNIICHDSNISIKEKKFFVKNMTILKDSVTTDKICSLNENMDFSSSNATIFIQKKQLVLENIIVKKKNYVLTIKKAMISLQDPNRAELLEIHLFLNNKLISTNISGHFDFKSNSLILLSGNIQLE